MKIELSYTENLEVVEFPFPVTFTFTKKGDEKFYFTPSGKCKLKIDRISTDHQNGKMSDEDYKAIMSEMKKKDSDILTDGRFYYTTGDKTLIRLIDIMAVMYKATEEWNARFAHV